MGELAALGASVLWTFTSIQFTLASRRVGSPALNRIRLVVAAIFLSLIHLLLFGELVPLHTELYRWGWLGLSSVVGLVLGDTSLFQAFVIIGPRRSMLLMTLAPVFSTLMAWGFLGESLLPAEIVAIMVTVGGIFVALSENLNRESSNGEVDRNYPLGLLLATCGAVGQALGLVLSKPALDGDFAPLSATLIRMLIASAAVWIYTLLRRPDGTTQKALKDRKTMLPLVSGALAGPTVAIWLTMFAIQNTPVGVTSTLTSLAPIILIPVERWLFHEKISMRAMVGTVIALIGAAALFMV